MSKTLAFRRMSPSFSSTGKNHLKIPPQKETEKALKLEKPSYPHLIFTLNTFPFTCSFSWFFTFSFDMYNSNRLSEFICHFLRLFDSFLSRQWFLSLIFLENWIQHFFMSVKTLCLKHSWLWIIPEFLWLRKHSGLTPLILIIPFYQFLSENKVSLEFIWYFFNYLRPSYGL